MMKSGTLHIFLKIHENEVILQASVMNNISNYYYSVYCLVTDSSFKLSR